MSLRDYEIETKMSKLTLTDMMAANTENVLGSQMISKHLAIT